MKTKKVGVKCRMVSLRAFLLATPHFERDEQPLTIGRRKVVALLAFLAHTGQPHTRDYLASLLWPEHDQSGALKNLRRDLGRLKGFVGEEALQADRLQIGLSMAAGIVVDTAVFQTRLQAAESHAHDPHNLCADCLTAVTEAVTLYNGDFMSGFNLPDCAEFDEWQFFEREALRQKLAEALQLLIGWHTFNGEFEKGIEYGRRWLALDSLHEPAHQQLMKLYAWAGQHSAALRQYETCVELLQEELGVEPEPETEELYEIIKRRELEPPPQRETAVSAADTPLPKALSPSDRYQIVKPLKAGGHAELFLGHDHLQNQPVVIKQIRPELINQPEAFVARFKREAEALRQLDHPNIVTMLDIFEQDGKQTIVMEYMPGGSLRELLEGGEPLETQRVLDIALELADALSRAHHLGIVHRDLKPDNVLLAADGTPRLADFGIARLEREDLRLTPTGSILGSPAYMSPEALCGEALDARTDIWSFGMILYEMLVGTRPFSGNQLTAIMISILNDPVPDIAEVLPDAPAGLAPLLQQMLVKERDGRLTSMRLAAAELEAIRAGTWQPGALFYASPNEPARLALPVPATPFVGREAELHHIGQSLTEQPDCRVLTIVGPGGSGKTRLALAVADQVQARFADGAYFVPLTALTAPEEIPLTIAEAVSIRLSGSDEPFQQLLRTLASRQLLLVLDNFEHLLSGVPLLVELLQAAPGIKILASSRERLQLVGEQVFVLQGLAVPQEATAVSPHSHSAITLFLQHVNLVRAGTAVQPEEWPDVVRICRLVQGMPLALVLAAGWANMLSFAEIGAEIAQSLDFLETDLQDLPVRQRSMRAVFDSSWKRLSPEEAAILPRLALFSGGFTREAAQTICGANLRLLRQLMNRSLIAAAEQRYEMHELLRQYALEKLTPDERASLQQQFISYFAAFMAQLVPGVQRSAYREASRQITTEQGNLSQAWSWLLTAVTEQPPTIENLELLRPFIAAWQFYYYIQGPLATARDLFTETVQKLETAVARQPVSDTAVANTCQTVIADLQTKAAFFNVGLGHYQLVDQYLEKAIPWLEENNDEPLLAFAYNCWAKASILRGQRELAEKQLLIALDYATKTDDYYIQADALKVLGVVAVDEGDYELAHARYQESLALFRANGFVPGMAMVLHNIGTVYSRQGEHRLALASYEEGMACAQEAGYERMIMEVMGAIGGTSRALGDHDKSERFLKQSITISKKLGDRRITASQLKNLGLTYLEMGDLLQAKRTLKSGLEISWSAQTIPDALSIVSAYARAIAQQGELVRALSILLFVQSQKEARQIDIDSYQPMVDDLLTELPDEMVAEAKQSSASLTLATVIEQLL